ncbi:adenylate/guanylate cyclase domain-containing protein [Ramlibacter sp. H39-3-26]|uniref:CHASE2 domain-containing protein n=1 Tax=Curvibacter soli TaxID=3031331 RepID=UPI0023DB4DAB|nr:adenylate/guanylate cyclase domain-containing protein [Ramlibacter sp. H39-3-26]MDF1485199.1 adenylate/guanylate cyclase domain-containing protein [Ramlibacter sp. H39-3-26]
MLGALSSLLARHGIRIAISLAPLLLAVLHASGGYRLQVLERLDNIIYDLRLRATMPGTLDERIVILDIDEKSLEQVGQWPWSRDKLATLVRELFDRQGVAIVGFDIVFAEPDGSSGLPVLRRLAQGPLRENPQFQTQLAQLAPTLDHDALFAQAMRNRPVVLGYYFTSDRGGRMSGVLPAPVLPAGRLQGRAFSVTTWDGYGASIAPIAEAAPLAGFFNPMTDADGIVRALPMLAEHRGQYYEALSLAMFRLLVGLPEVHPGFPAAAGAGYQSLAYLELQQGGRSLAVPVGEQVTALIPFRGHGGANGGSFRYIPAADVLAGQLPAAALQGKIVLIGTTAPGLLDLRATPVNPAYPGVETHANVLSGLLDAKSLVRPDYAMGYEMVAIALVGLGLALGLPFLGVLQGIALCLGLAGLLVAHNTWLYLRDGLVLPLAATLCLGLAVFILDMGYGYFVESRSKRRLARLFGTYVPPELVDEMVKSPGDYSMRAANRELTVMFCDMRGFTAMSESMDPVQLQALLNEVFSRLTAVIRARLGTIDKYMGDCIMAFWGAPVETPGHAALAVQAALEMAQAVHAFNAQSAARGIPRIGIGIGINTGPMCVGDMGSDIRRSYTVIGDAVNLGSRLEGLCKTYGVEIVVSDSTHAQAPAYTWQELDRVRVKGKAQAVGIYQPLPAADAQQMEAELAGWAAFLAAYRAQDWPRCQALLQPLRAAHPQNHLYQLYQQRVQAMCVLPFDPTWDGATNFDTK